MTSPNRLTTLRDLAPPFIGCVALSYVVFVSAYASIPSLRAFTAAPLFALAVGELAAAARVRAAVRHRAGAKPIAAISVARLVALAKASALVGAGVLGASLGALLRLVPDLGRLAAVRGDSVAAALIGVAAVVLVGAARTLERAAVDPSRTRRS